jgi:hypothetical protein
MLLGRRNRSVGVFSLCDHAIAGIVLNLILERFRQLSVVLDDQDPEHPRLPTLNSAMLARIVPRANPR